MHLFTYGMQIKIMYGKSLLNNKPLFSGQSSDEINNKKMNEKPKIQQSSRNRNNNFQFRRPNTIRVIHKEGTPKINSTTSVPAVAPRKNTNQNPSQNQNQNKISRGSYQYGNTKGGRRPHIKTPPPPKENNTFVRKNKTNLIPPILPGVIRIIPLGGVEEIGKNMTAIEIGNDIIVVDAGMQFKTEDTPGIDYIIPNTTYLEERKDKIRAMLVTHGHLDHIGGIPLVMSRIGNPPLYSRNLSILVMKKRQEEFPHLEALKTNIVEKDSVIYAGDLRIRFFGVTHTMPDSMGIVIETPYGSIVTPGDYKLDQIDGVVSDEEEKEYAFFDKEKVLLLLTDSTNIENEGFSLPEVRVHEGLEKLIRQGTGRIIISAFASSITRLMKIVEIAESLGKKVIFDGRSLKNNMEICEQAGIFTPKKGTIINY